MRELTTIGVLEEFSTAEVHHGNTEDTEAARNLRSAEKA
jgi:hypothetical protein